MSIHYRAVNHGDVVELRDCFMYCNLALRRCRGAVGGVCIIPRAMQYPLFSYKICDDAF